MKFVLITFLCAIVLALSVSAQTTKRNSRPAAPKPAATPAPQAVVEPAPSPTPSGKRNERPQNSNASSKTASAVAPNYIYEFDQPAFLVSHVVIEHDEAGRGKISFLKTGLEGPETDPITLSPVTLDKIKAAIAALNFLESTDSYQTVRDYSHMGNVSITYRKDGRERTTKYNWSDNKDAKLLMDEYRKISNQYVWQFDMSIARENQPLNAPGLMDALDSYIQRSEISDPKQMVPLLKELANDERIPLIARNHATKLAEKIEKAK